MPPILASRFAGPQVRRSLGPRVSRAESGRGALGPRRERLAYFACRLYALLT